MARRMIMSRSSPAALAWLTGGVLVAFFLYLIVGIGRIAAPPPDYGTVARCIEQYKGQVTVTTVSVGTLYDLNRFCYDSIGSQYRLDFDKVRRDSFVFQRNENVILLYMVVLITISGVVLAGVQLLASYRLAVAGRGELAGGATEVGYSTHKVSFKSSVIGLTILALSFAFFLVFVTNVYEMKEASSDTGVPRPASVPQQLPTNLIPVLPPSDQPRASGEPGSTAGAPSSAATAERR